MEAKEKHGLKLRDERRRSRTAYLGTVGDQKAREARARFRRPGFAGTGLERREKDG